MGAEHHTAPPTLKAKLAHRITLIRQNPTKNISLQPRFKNPYSQHVCDPICFMTVLSAYIQRPPIGLTAPDLVVTDSNSNPPTQILGTYRLLLAKYMTVTVRED